MAADTATKEKPDVKKKALAKRPEPATQVALGPVLTYEDLIRQADDFIKTGFLPTAIKTPQQAVAIVLMGRELGVPMMQSLREIYVVAGKPTLSGQMMLGLARSTREGLHPESQERRSPKGDQVDGR